MQLKQDALAVLQAGGNHEALLAVVRRCLADGVPDRQVYDVLQGIWLDFGFDWKDEGGMQDELEYVMERVWFWGKGA